VQLLRLLPLGVSPRTLAQPIAPTPGSSDQRSRPMISSMPRTVLMLQTVCALAAALLTIVLVAAGRGWLLVLGVALWIGLVWWGARSWRSIAQSGIVAWPFRPTPRQRDAWAIALLVGVAVLMMIVVLAARLSWA